jgi:hypothetical protein
MLFDSGLSLPSKSLNAGYLKASAYYNRFNLRERTLWHLTKPKQLKISLL